jgi:Trypsin-like peptidase domain
VKTKLLTIILTLLLALPIPSIAQSPKKPHIAQNSSEVYASTFALYGSWNNNTRFMCTATPYEATPTGYHLITAGHCVKGGLPPNLKFYVAEDINANLALQTVTVLKAENNDKYDFAILNLNTPRDYAIVPINDGKFPEVGSEVVNVNFALGLTKQLGTGTVASKQMNESADNGECGLCKNRYIVHINGGPGASGSAVIDTSSGEIVGLVEAEYQGEQLGMIVIPMSIFHEFIVDGSIPDYATLQKEAEKVVTPTTNPKKKYNGSKHGFLGIF